jgi:hypothetical protein
MLARALDMSRRTPSPVRTIASKQWRYPRFFSFSLLLTKSQNRRGAGEDVLVKRTLAGRERPWMAAPEARMDASCGRPRQSPFDGRVLAEKAPSYGFNNLRNA